MATEESLVEYICSQGRGAREPVYKKMFGEYAIYLNEKVIALVCDNRLFVKPTSEGREILGTPEENPPYPGAKPHFEVGPQIDDRKIMTRLFEATERSLPTAKAKAAKRKTKRPK
jgi:TfoX/Sxy family transcriptional regulator of competence genes